MSKDGTNPNCRILDRFVEKSKYFGPFAIGSGCCLLIFIFVRCGRIHEADTQYSWRNTLKDNFPIVLMIISYTLYIARVHWSLGALAKCESFWRNAEKFFTDCDHICDNFCKMVLAVLLFVSAAAFIAAELGYIGQHLEWFLFAILTISVFWQFIIHRRLKKLVNINKIDESDVTTAISSWLKLDFLLACFLLLFNVYSKIPALSDYPLIEADAFFWVHILFTGQDIYKNKPIYKLC